MAGTGLDGPDGMAIRSCPTLKERPKVHRACGGRMEFHGLVWYCYDCGRSFVIRGRTVVDVSLMEHDRIVLFAEAAKLGSEYLERLI